MLGASNISLPLNGDNICYYCMLLQVAVSIIFNVLRFTLEFSRFDGNSKFYIEHLMVRRGEPKICVRCAINGKNVLF